MKENPHIFSAKIEWRKNVREKWGDKAARHLHFADGITLLAQQDNTLVGMLAVQLRSLPAPSAHCTEAFIDIIEVDSEYRRRQIGSRLVMVASDLALESGAYQLRAWTSEDKNEALPFWGSLGFGLAPATVQHGELEIRGFYVTKVLDLEAKADKDSRCSTSRLRSCQMPDW